MKTERTPGGWHLIYNGLPTKKDIYLVIVKSRYLWPEPTPWQYDVDIAESHVTGEKNDGVMDNFWCGSLNGFTEDEECHVVAWMPKPGIPFEVMQRERWKEELQMDEKREKNGN